MCIRDRIEGGVVQGLGWMTMEEIVYNDKGRLLSNALSTYTVSYTHLRTHETVLDLVCRLLLETQKSQHNNNYISGHTMIHILNNADYFITHNV